MARNGTWLVALVAVFATAGADEGLVERWDKPRVESFALKDAMPQEVLREIRTRFDVPVEDLALDLPRMDFEAKDVTFFEALDRLAAAHGLLLRGGAPGEEPLSLVRPKRKLPPIPVCHVGPSRLSVERTSVLTATHWGEEPTVFGGTDAIERYLNDRADVPRLRLGLRWMAEPGLELALVAFDVREARYDTGADVAILTKPDLPIATDGTFSVDLDPPSRNVRSIAKLAGRLRVAIPVAQEEVEFKAGAGRERKQLGDARVWIEDVDAKPPIVRFAIDGVPCAALQPCFEARKDSVHVGSGGGRRVAVTFLAYRADGAEIAGSVKRMWSDSSFTSATYWIALEEAPARIVLRAPTTARVREAPFSFTDIPLPE